MSAVENTTMARAIAAWNGCLPDWVAALATACDATSGRAVAARLGVSPAAVSRVIGHNYGDTAAMERRVQDCIMTVVACPVLGEIPRERCIDEQRRPFAATNAVRVRLFRACHNGCPHMEAPHDPHTRTGQGHPALDRAGQVQTSRPAAAGSAQKSRP